MRRHAAEVKVISANGMREVIAETKAKFEAASGHKLRSPWSRPARSAGACWPANPST